MRASWELELCVSVCLTRDFILRLETVLLGKQRTVPRTSGPNECMLPNYFLLFSRIPCISATVSDVTGYPTICFSCLAYSLPNPLPGAPLSGYQILGWMSVSLQVFSSSEHSTLFWKLALTLFKMQFLPTYRFSPPSMVKLYWFFMASSVTMEIDGF